MPVDYLQAGVTDELNFSLLWTTLASGKGMILTWRD